MLRDRRHVPAERGWAADGEHFRLMVMTSEGDQERELSRTGTVGTPSWTPR